MTESFKQEIIIKKIIKQLNNENYYQQNMIFAEKTDRFKKEFDADVFILIQ